MGVPDGANQEGFQEEVMRSCDQGFQEEVAMRVMVSSEAEVLVGSCPQFTWLEKVPRLPPESVGEVFLNQPPWQHGQTRLQHRGRCAKGHRTTAKVKAWRMKNPDTSLLRNKQEGMVGHLISQGCQYLIKMNGLERRGPGKASC